MRIWCKAGIKNKSEVYDNDFVISKFPPKKKFREEMCNQFEAN